MASYIGVGQGKDRVGVRRSREERMGERDEMVIKRHCACIGNGVKPSNTFLNHHLFQGPDLEVLSDVSTSGGVSVGNVESGGVCFCTICV